MTYLSNPFFHSRNAAMQCRFWSCQDNQNKNVLCFILHRSIEYTCPDSGFLPPSSICKPYKLCSAYTWTMKTKPLCSEILPLSQFLTLSLCLALAVPGNFAFGSFNQTKRPSSFPISCHSILHWYLQTFPALTWENIHLKRSPQCTIKLHWGQKLYKAEILFCLQVNKLACQFHGYLQKMQDSWIRNNDVIIHGIAGSMNFMFTMFSAYPKTHGCAVEQRRGHSHAMGLFHGWEALSF